jgi:hypothetical protein
MVVFHCGGFFHCGVCPTQDLSGWSVSLLFKRGPEHCLAPFCTLFAGLVGISAGAALFASASFGSTAQLVASSDALQGGVFPHGTPQQLTQQGLHVMNNVALWLLLECCSLGHGGGHLLAERSGGLLWAVLR